MKNLFEILPNILINKTPSLSKVGTECDGNTPLKS
jgi:hypothetical protein